MKSYLRIALETGVAFAILVGIAIGGMTVFGSLHPAPNLTLLDAVGALAAVSILFGLFGGFYFWAVKHDRIIWFARGLAYIVALGSIVQIAEDWSKGEISSTRALVARFLLLLFWGAVIFGLHRKPKQAGNSN